MSNPEEARHFKPVLNQQLYWVVGVRKVPKDSPLRQRPNEDPTPPYQWEGPIDMSVTISVDEALTFKVTGVDDYQNPADLTGQVVYAIDDSSLATLTDHGDGTADVVPTGKPGVVTVSVTDAETDGKQFIGGDAITITSGEVSAVSLTPGTPYANPNAPGNAQPSQPAQPSSGS